jgi:hypothetical protein
MDSGDLYWTAVRTQLSTSLVLVSVLSYLNLKALAFLFDNSIAISSCFGSQCRSYRISHSPRPRCQAASNCTWSFVGVAPFPEFAAWYEFPSSTTQFPPHNDCNWLFVLVCSVFNFKLLSSDNNESVDSKTFKMGP